MGTAVSQSLVGVGRRIRDVEGYLLRLTGELGLGDSSTRQKGGMVSRSKREKEKRTGTRDSDSDSGSGHER